MSDWSVLPPFTKDQKPPVPFARRLVDAVSLLVNQFSLLHAQLFDVAARDRHEYGWTGSLAKLERYLQEIN